MWMVGLWLKFCGYRVKSIGYPSHRVSIADAVRKHLNPALEQLEIEPGSRVHFVTHSLGGIVFRAWAAQRDPTFPLGRAVAAQFLFCKSGDQVWDGSAECMLR